MFKIAIVEDEKILLDDLEEMIDWESMGVEVAYTERNGVNALHHIMREPVDIVITDIRMPVMSGIEMVQKIREHNKNIQIIFLTGYEEVGYMKSAMGVDAVSYLLKPLQEEELKQAVKRAIEKVELIKNAQIGKLKRLETELMGLVMNQVEPKLLEKGAYTLVLAYVSRFQTLNQTRSIVEVSWILDKVRENLQNFFQYRSEKVIISYLSKGQFMIAAEDREGYIRYGEVEQKELNEGLNNLCQIILITTGEDMVYEADQLYEAYQKILKRQKNSFYEGIRPQKGYKGTLAQQKKRLCHDIPKMTEVEIMEHLSEFFGQIADEKPERTQVVNDCFDIGCSIYDSFQQKYKPNGMLYSEKRDISATLEEFDYLGQIEKYLKQLYQNYVRADKDVEDIGDVSKVVQKIINHIEQHYAEPISAESLAEEVYFSSNTLRIMMKKQTGDTIHEYLTRVRLEKAAELLKYHDKKIGQVAKEVGYDSASYFCMKFSKDYGMSPLAYRKKYLDKNHWEGEYR